MHAVVLPGPGGPESFELTELPLPGVPEGWVRIRVEAFGINRSELMTRRGLSGGAVTWPRVLGIECVGVVDEASPTSGLRPGQQVAALMGGMGRAFDGSYAEFVSVPASSVVPFSTDLPWEVVGALPEMIQTAHGSLTTGVDLQAGQTVLIRGGTSSVGLAAAALAKRLGASVVATTRRADRLDFLAGRGVDHPIVDEGSIDDAVRRIAPDGVDGAVELVGARTLPDTLRCVRVHGTACFTGMLSQEWVIPDFYPMETIPAGVRLTAYSGEASDLPAPVLQAVLDDVAAGAFDVAVHHVYDGLGEVARAHEDMEANRATGKLVVRVRH